jgi:predicted GIY-YIG superfamily endonuclease
MGNEQTVEEQSSVKTLYVLELQKGKRYVGVTNDLQRRLTEHEEGSVKRNERSEWRGSAYTKKYPVVRLYSQEPLTSDFQEDMKVKELMGKYGIDNVRGGKYSRVRLTKEEKLLLQGEIEHAFQLCFKCKKQGHCITNCPLNKNESAVKKKEAAVKKTNVCERCGRKGHAGESCFAHTNSTGETFCRGANKNGLHCANKVTGNYDYCFTHKDQK